MTSSLLELLSQLKSHIYKTKQILSAVGLVSLGDMVDMISLCSIIMVIVEQTSLQMIHHFLNQRN